MTSNGFQASYSNDRPPSSQGSGGGEGDVVTDPASSGFFVNDYKRHEDLKQMLDTNKDALKLEAMKRIIGMVAKGKDASDLFPAVVKNVVAKNIEVKKLVYVYLTRYAEEQQDLALLSISSFQRALKDPNQLIRASALRVLSSIRVQMIVPIMMLAIKDSVMDMSPYVRKTAAHAIPKLYSIEPEQKDQLIDVIEKLLGDKTTLVAGSAIQAFEEVCPERIDLIHKNFRKLCNLLVDVDEWGQVAIINMLTRYCRTQFMDPNPADTTVETEEKAFYASSDDEDSERGGGGQPEEKSKKKPYIMDPDHRLLLRNTKPLLSSRNAAVVMAVSQLYHHCAPRSEVVLVARAMIRLLRSHKEVQFIVLSNVASMSVHRKDLFEPFLKSFYVRSNDPTHVKLLKLEILTNLATENNISIILREFQTYVTSADQEFAAATIQAIGRCASNIAEITDTCLNGLVSLLSNRNETVVGESVVVIKKLLQMQSSEHQDIISHLARLVDNITVPLARASILWLIGEYSDRVPRLAPDVLRKMAKGFTEEEDIVKLQILNLAAKLCITNPKQTKLLCQYIFNLAKYDQNYDIRDRSRFMRALIMPGDKAGQLSKHAKKIFLSTKPAPVVESKFKDHDQYQLGTLTHVINKRAQGYQDLPEWPEEAPDPGVRNVTVVSPWTESVKKDRGEDRKKKKSFYSDDDDSSSTSGPDSSGSSTEDSSDSSASESDSNSSSSSGSSSESGSESTDTEEEMPASRKKPAKTKTNEVPTVDLLAGPLADLSLDTPTTTTTTKPPPSTQAPPTRPPVGALDAGSSVSESTSSSSSGSESSGTESDGEESEEEVPEPPKHKVKSKPARPAAQTKEKSEKAKKQKTEETKKPSAMLLDLDDFGPPVQTPVMLPGALLSPSNQTPAAEVKPKPNYTNIMTTVFVPHIEHELLNKFSGQGLSATYRFTRTVSIFSPKMTSVELTFTNHGDSDVENIRLGNKKLQPGMELHEFPEISSLAKNCTTSTLMAIDFNDTTQAAKFEVIANNKKLSVQIVAPVGELLIQDTIMEKDFHTMQGKLSGMNENSASLSLEDTDPQTIQKAVLTHANVLQVPATDPTMHLFAGKTVHSGSPLLVSIKVSEKKAKLRVNCEKMVIGSMLLRDIKKELSS